jgi:hypothetical protein
MIDFPDAANSVGVRKELKKLSQIRLVCDDRIGGISLFETDVIKEPFFLH